MILNNFKLSDEVYETYLQEAADRKVKVGDLLRERLEKAVALDPRDHPLILTGGRTMQQIEDHLGGGNIRGAEDLLQKVRRLANIKFGEHEFVISPGQYQELAHRATKLGLTHEQFIARMWTKISEDFFRYVP